MTCPNCANAVISGVICPNCSVDTELYIGIVRLSDRLYDQGLERLRASDMSRGIEFLQKSVAINKNNVMARNLLGLVLFECGEIGEALRQWVISENLVKSNNPATRYLDTVKRNSRILDRLNDSIDLYNQALIHISNASDDLAIIELKKAVETNPKFVHAINLLTLCYLWKEDRDRALAQIERLLAFDVLNPQALFYYSYLYPGRVRPDTRSRQQQNKQAPPPTPTPAVVTPPQREMPMALEKKSKNFHLEAIITFVATVLLMVLFYQALIMPGFNRSNARELQQYQQYWATTEAELESTIRGYQQQATNLRNEARAAADEAQELRTENEQQDRVIRIWQAAEMYRAGNLRDAVSRIAEIDPEGLPHDIREKGENIVASVFPQLAQTYFTQGQQAFAIQDFDRALVLMEDAHYFMDTAAPQYPQMLLTLGRLYFRNVTQHSLARNILLELEQDARFANLTAAERAEVTTMLAGLTP